MPSMMRISKEWEKGWLDLVQRQQEIYRFANIQVTLSKEIKSYGAGDSASVKNETVGLKFDAASVRGEYYLNTAVIAHAELVHSPGMINKGLGDDYKSASLSRELEILSNLYNTGSLTREEFAAAKASVLASR